MRRSRKYGDHRCGIVWTGARVSVRNSGTSIFCDFSSTHTSSNCVPLNTWPDGLPKIGVSARPL